MKKTFKKTVTVGIPAHNEEKNISKLLDSILAQKGENFIFNRIVVSCDGCTDDTASIVRRFSIQYKTIRLHDDGKRLGQSGRLNEFYTKLDSDIFITFDGDSTLGHDNVISEIVSCFDDKDVVLVGGSTIPFPQHNFIGKCVETYEYFWRMVIKNINNGDNIHNHKGPISAGTKEFLSSVSRPKNIIANDHFLFLEAMKRGNKFKFAKNAYVYIHVPSTFQDYMKQRTRFLSSANDLKIYFGDWVLKYYAIPFRIKAKYYLVTLAKYPFYMPFSVLLVTIQKLVSCFYKENLINGKWSPIQSSK